MSLAALAASFLLAAAADPNCPDEPGWSSQTVSLTSECPVEFASPDGRHRLLIDAEGQVRVDGGSALLLIDPPGMMSWSPSSDALFINDGDGSGLGSDFKLLHRMSRSFVRDDRVATQAVARYRARVLCDTALANPNVWGIGWSPDGKRVSVLVQSTGSYQGCGSPDEYRIMTFDVASAAVIEDLSAKEAWPRYSGWLAPNLKPE